MSDVYQLSLTRDYVSNWTYLQAVRELLQNAIDNPLPFEWMFKEGRLHIYNRNTVLPVSSLLLGSSTKQTDDSKIGGFGEGYKLALLVLLREGKAVTIYNGKNIWVPCFRYNSTFDCDILTIASESHFNVSHRDEDLEFVISGLTSAEIKEIEESCLQMQTTIGRFIETKYGDILLDKQGKVYVNGLHIYTDKELRYSYNIKAEHIKLERDRSTVNSFDLYWTTTQMWGCSKEVGLITDMLENEIADIKFAEHLLVSEEIADAAYEKANTTYPGYYYANTQAVANKFKGCGVKNVAVLPSSYVKLIESSSKYKNSRKQIKDDTPTDKLKNLLKGNGRNIRKPARIAIKKLIAESSNWS